VAAPYTFEQQQQQAGTATAHPAYIAASHLPVYGDMHATHQPDSCQLPSVNMSHLFACACLQDLLAALILSECVYKKLEMPPDQLREVIAEFLADFPPELVHIEAVQLSLEDVTQK
jgi:hypothetical protein